MKIIYSLLFIIAFSLFGCSKEQAGPRSDYQVPEGMCAVNFTLGGVIGESLIENKNNLSRMGNKPGDEIDSKTLENVPVKNLDDGTTLWVYAEETTGYKSHRAINSYVVRNISGTETGQQMLYPCIVDEDGNVIEESSVPMFLNIGSTYKFSVVSPARKFVDEEKYSLFVNNKEYVLSNDIRYSQTQPLITEILGDESFPGPVQIVSLNPIINQTSQLEFTIYAEDNDPNIYSLDILPQGVEISGIQYQYDRKMNSNADSWNWTWNDTLKASVGQNTEKVIIRKMGTDAVDDSFISKNADGSLYIKCPVLPTDAFSSSIIVLFNIEVNGVPTQFEMMLNQKILRSAYTYHYKGKIGFENGASVITWQYVNWNIDAPVIIP